MAKDKTEKKDKVEKPAVEKAPEKKYGINDLAAALGKEPASVRVQLRAAKIAKEGGRYGWDTKKEMDEVIDAIKALKAKAAPKKSGKKAKADEDDDDED